MRRKIMRFGPAQRTGRRPGAALRPGPLALIALALIALPGGPGMLSTLASAAHAQTVNDRVVQGKVELSTGQPAQGAIVYIKNAKTLEVRTYISTADGSYRFAQLKTDADYAIWAEYQGKKSKEKTISSFDSKKIFTITLRIG